jgi:hypothetical protein
VPGKGCSRESIGLPCEPIAAGAVRVMECRRLLCAARIRMSASAARPGAGSAQILQELDEEQPYHPRRLKPPSTSNGSPVLSGITLPARASSAIATQPFCSRQKCNKGVWTFLFSWSILRMASSIAPSLPRAAWVPSRMRSCRTTTMGVARILDKAAVEILQDGVDTSPGVQFAPPLASSFRNASRA